MLSPLYHYCERFPSLRASSFHRLSSLFCALSVSEAVLFGPLSFFWLPGSFWHLQPLSLFKRILPPPVSLFHVG